jgi:hypothetical protein
MVTKPPAPQAISRLLGGAGFTRSEPGTEDEGYRVRTRHHPAPPVVLVTHFMLWTTEGRKARQSARLADYAATLTTAGYQVEATRSAGAAALAVRAREAAHA